MHQTTSTENEVARLRALQELGLLDMPDDHRFDRITRLTKVIFDTPIVFISFVGKDQQLLKSSIGTDIISTPRSISFCHHAIEQDKLMIVEDALLDERFQDNPLVIGDPHIRFYAGAVLRSYDQYPIGTLCIIDTKPRQLSEYEQTLLLDLAQGAQNELHLHFMHALQQENQRLSWISGQISNGVLYTDVNQRIVWCNEGFSRLSGYRLDELRGKKPSEILQGPETSQKTIQKLKRQIDKEWPFEADILNYNKSGKAYWVHIYGVPLRSSTGDIYGYIAIQRDVTAKMNSYLELKKLAYVDELTGLANRRYLDERLEQLTASVSINTQLALFIIDLNGFKRINDTFGHLAGDEVLAEVASRLINVTKQEDILSRLGGDEFAIVINGITQYEITRTCERLLKLCLEPILLETGDEVAFGMSIGVARYPDDANTVKTLFQLADQAMYQAKQNQTGASIHTALNE
jgi:diguanylate cyclase (GGDEF)-like protein/PAS domain S-box-containing protein